MRPLPPPSRSLILMSLLLSACNVMPERPAGTFVERELALDGAIHHYQVFVPPAKAAGKQAPIILFLHGSGERGSDGVKPTMQGLGPYVRARAQEFPAIVVFPQAADNSEWAGDNVDMAIAMLEAATREFGGDPERTYLTGISMGGYGTWEFAMRHPRRFAALVPVCGGIHPHGDRPTLRVEAVSGAADPYAETAQTLRAIPIWIFHGAKDDVVLPEQSRKLAAALKAANAADARYTEFPDANHNAWDPAYATPDLWAWMFAQRRR